MNTQSDSFVCFCFVFFRFQELLTTFYLGFISLIFASFVLYMVEKDSNSEFDSWPSSFWWGIVSTFVVQYLILFIFFFSSTFSLFHFTLFSLNSTSLLLFSAALTPSILVLIPSSFLSSSLPPSLPLPLPLSVSLPFLPASLFPSFLYPSSLPGCLPPFLH